MDQDQRELIPELYYDTLNLINPNSGFSPEVMDVFNSMLSLIESTFDEETSLAVEAYLQENDIYREPPDNPA